MKDLISGAIKKEEEEEEEVRLIKQWDKYLRIYYSVPYIEGLISVA